MRSKALIVASTGPVAIAQGASVVTRFDAAGVDESQACSTNADSLETAPTTLRISLSCSQRFL